MLVVDTNILIDAANARSEFHEPCRATIEQCRARASPWYVSWPICYEFLRVCTHPNIFPKPWSFDAAWRFLEALLQSPAAGILLPTRRHSEFLTALVTEVPQLRGNIFHDVHTAVLMREHGIKQIYTRDSDFHRFSFITVIDPAR